MTTEVSLLHKSGLVARKRWATKKERVRERERRAESSFEFFSRCFILLTYLQAQCCAHAPCVLLWVHI